MPAKTIDEYLDALPEPERAALQHLRETIIEIVPHATELISYGMPAFRVDGKVVAGFAAFKRHLSYLPHSGSVLGTLEEDLSRYDQTPGSLHFMVDRPLPKTLVRRLIAARLREIRETATRRRAR